MNVKLIEFCFAKFLNQAIRGPETRLKANPTDTVIKAILLTDNSLLNQHVHNTNDFLTYMQLIIPRLGFVGIVIPAEHYFQIRISRPSHIEVQ